MKSNYRLKQLIGTLLFFSVIFFAAGRIDYWQGWVYISLGLIMFLLEMTVLRMDAELAKERSKPGPDTKKWDKLILGLSFLVTLAMFVTAGLDSGRFHWSLAFPPVTILAGILLTATGQLLFLTAQKQNKFFSSTVRIQTDREHVVCENGLYSFIRHPAYLGSMLQAMGFPLLFESLWSVIPVFILILLLIIRTYLEDKVLFNELKGYREYAVKIRYRLIPFIW